MTVATPPAVYSRTETLPKSAPVSGPTAAPPRITSIDALRGFDMFWIMGPYVGHKMVFGLATWIWGSKQAAPAWIRYHFDHPRWEGFSAWDMIMPLFLFIVGAAMPFSIGRRIDEGAGRSSIYLKMIRRVVLLWILGMISQGNLLEFKLERLRLYSNTLQSIAAGYLIATIVLVELRSVRWHLAVTAGLIVLYWALMSFVPFGGHRGEYGEQTNLAILIDKALLGRFQDGTTYTWILSSLGFGATVMMGVLAGEVLRSMSIGGWNKVGILAAGGAACLALGWGWKLISPPIGMPMIKHIWSGSMILWAGGWSLLLLGLFYAIIDVLGYRAWAYFFVVIGANAIVAYMCQKLFNVWGISQTWFGGLTAHLGRGADFALAFCAMAITWLGLWFLYRKRVFLRV
jgi:predicted acyltransferase